jgi:acyl-CoA reductase-like NAD-dependent aldehyde dehydrogenase
MDKERRIKAFARLGKFMKAFAGKEKTGAAETQLHEAFGEKMEAVIKASFYHNGWFTEENVRNAFGAQSAALEEEKLRQWLGNYPGLENTRDPKRVGVIMAGNVPMVGFHDMLCVLISGNTFVGKLSSADKLLLPALAEALIAIEPGFGDRIVFTEGQLRSIDAVIATGSNNTARYFEHYFGKYPNIIRKNRNSVAVLDGSETEEEMRALGEDIFRYFGLGCRNVQGVYAQRI